jgi:hypothetical protein
MRADFVKLHWRGECLGGAGVWGDGVFRNCGAGCCVAKCYCFASYNDYVT